jgi:hypothetical protein
MKQTILIRWIETAEARSVCEFATENPRWVTSVISPNRHLSQATLAKLKCLPQAAHRLVPSRRTWSAP